MKRVSTKKYELGDRKTIAPFLLDQFRAAGLHAIVDEDASDVRIWIKVNIPHVGIIPLSAMVLNNTLRVTAHRAVEGVSLGDDFNKCNELNLSPWVGRIYNSPDNFGADLSFGLPLPTVEEVSFPLGFYVYLLCKGVSALRDNRPPVYLGPQVPSIEQLRDLLVSWANDMYVPYSSTRDGDMVVIDTVTPQEHSVRLEVCIIDRALCVVRIQKELHQSVEKESLRSSIMHINQIAPAGAIAWHENLKRLCACVVQYPAVIPFGKYHLKWALNQAMDLFNRIFLLVNQKL